MPTAGRTIHVEVDYYDRKHRELLLAYPNASAIAQSVARGVDVPLAEFYTYFLFHRKPGRNGRLSYRRLAEQTYKAKAWLDDEVDLDSGSLVQSRESDRIPNDIIEHIGEAVGLSVVNRLFDLTEADWQRIPIGRTKSFDYEYDIASDGTNIIQLETKGSSVSDPQQKTPSISNHKSSIEEKKSESVAENPSQNQSTTVRLGTITVIPETASSFARCWLLDPPAVRMDFSPRKVRILKRLSFLHAWISFISPRSMIAIALANRLRDLVEISEPDVLSGTALLDGEGRPIEPRTIVTDRQQRLSFFATKSVVTDSPAGGIVAQATESRFFFFGIREDLVNLASEQDYERILGYRSASAVVEKTVSCVFSRSRFRRLDLPSDLQRRVRHSKQYSTFDLRGDLHYSPGGLVFGALEAR